MITDKQEKQTIIIFTIVTILMTCTGAIVMVYSFYKSNRFDIVSENEKLTERLKQNYCCPHCSLPLTGMGEYATLSKKINISKKCPHCGKRNWCRKVLTQKERKENE